MPTQITLADIETAWNAQDKITPYLFIELINTPQRSKTLPPREGAYSFENFIREIRADSFKVKSQEEQKHFRIEALKRLEGDTAELPLSEKLKSHELLMRMWRDNSQFSRWCLKQIIQGVNLHYGPWKAMKRIFKEAESGDIEMYAVLAARFDKGLSGRGGEVSYNTLMYLSRRAWRYLRGLAVSLPASYADHASQILQNYSENTNIAQCWIANHIFYHESGEYTSKAFHCSNPNDLTTNRAFAHLWQRTPRPLLSLLENANSEWVRKFAVESLKKDFQSSLREMQPDWILQLVDVDSAIIDDFGVWLLKNVPKFEQSALRELGLHEVVLQLFDSKSRKAATFAAEYARVYARDLELDRLIVLLNNENQDVRNYSLDMLKEKDPRKDIGLQAFTRILQSKYGYEFAKEALLNQFSATELHTDWFLSCLLTENQGPIKFCTQHLLKIHSLQELGRDFFCRVIDGLMQKDTWKNIYEIDQHLKKTSAFVFDQLKTFELKTLDPKWVQTLFVWPLGVNDVIGWVEAGQFRAQALPIEFYRDLAYEPDWNKSKWLENLYTRYRLSPGCIEYSDTLSEHVLSWLRDHQRFPAKQTGFNWLLELLGSDHPGYQQFAEDMLNYRFTPADYSREESAPDPQQAGCERLWEMLTDTRKSKAFLASFALNYLRLHHQHIGRPLARDKFASEALIPEAFLSFERCKPLFAEKRTALRKFALELAHWEMNRWSPHITDIVDLCGSPHEDVQTFVEKALFVQESAENKTFRLDTGGYDANEVFQFCHSRNRHTREIGLRLIDTQPRLKLPELLLKLAQSGDRKVRAFGIKKIWQTFRHRNLFVTAKAEPPADPATLKDLLRKSLFELPQARPPKNTHEKSENEIPAIKLVSTRKTKLAMIETLRDLAVENEEFARYISPLFREFLHSVGDSEKIACLVALTRINHSHELSL